MKRALTHNQLSWIAELKSYGERRRAKIKHLYDSGLSVKQIALIEETSRQRVYAILAKSGYTRRSKQATDPQPEPEPTQAE